MKRAKKSKDTVLREVYDFLLNADVLFADFELINNISFVAPEDIASAEALFFHFTTGINPANAVLQIVNVGETQDATMQQRAEYAGARFASKDNLASAKNTLKKWGVIPKRMRI